VSAVHEPERVARLARAILSDVMLYTPAGAAGIEADDLFGGRLSQSPGLFRVARRSDADAHTNIWNCALVIARVSQPACTLRIW
jgi:hypothetical protein